MCSTDSVSPSLHHPSLPKLTVFLQSTAKDARPRFPRGSCYCPDPHCSQFAPNSCDSSSSSTVFADYDSGVVFSGLYTASGESITTHEFDTKPHRGLAPTLCLIIPDGNSSSSNLPSFALTVPSPISPTHPLSPVLLPVPRFTRESYLAAAVSAPPSSRVPNLPLEYCPHVRYLPPRNRWCSLCELQQLACEIWLGSRGSMLSAPNILPAANTPQTRAVYYALRLPLGRLERECVDVDDVIAISIMRLPTRVRGSRSRKSCDTGSKSKPVVAPSVVATRAPAAPSRIRALARRVRHVLSAPTRRVVPS